MCCIHLWFEGPLKHRAQSPFFPVLSMVLSSSFYISSLPFLGHCLGAHQNHSPYSQPSLRPWLINLLFQPFHDLFRIWTEKVLQTLTSCTIFFVRRAEVPLVRMGYQTFVHDVPSPETLCSPRLRYLTHLDRSSIVTSTKKPSLAAPISSNALWICFPSILFYVTERGFYIYFCNLVSICLAP